HSRHLLFADAVGRSFGSLPCGGYRKSFEPRSHESCLQSGCKLTGIESRGFDAMQILSRLKEWMQSSERRRAERIFEPGTVAFYWDGSVPVPRDIRDISLTGAYLCTPERWYPETIVKIVLKSTRPDNDAAAKSLEVACRVVRHGPDGVGLQFISYKANERKGLNRFLTGLTSNLRRAKSTRAETSAKGQSLVEFALMIPLLFILIVLIVDF